MNDQQSTISAGEKLSPNVQPSFLSLATKIAICHTITYLIMGALAYNFLHYAELIARPCSGMRPMTDPLVRGGALFQPLRGVLFALVFYPLRERIFGVKRGWLLMGWMLVALGILGTFAAAPGSMEGLIYLHGSDFRTVARTPGNRHPGAAAFGLLLLLGQPSRQKVADLAAEHSLLPGRRGRHAGPDGACQVITAPGHK